VSGDDGHAPAGGPDTAAASRPRRHYIVAALVVGVLTLAAALGARPLDMPSPRPAGAPATTFSAGRAMVQLERLAATPRPMGSPEAARQRQAIVAELSRLGLAPTIQSAEVVSTQSDRVGGTVHNVVASLSGTGAGRSLLLVAHYDSVAIAPGAADDGTGVVVLLETARALRAGSPLRNDVVFLFTDGEERGMLGARAFLREHPYAYRVGVVLDVDSPGTSSPLLMYETSPDNGRLVRELLGAVDRPYTSSLMYEVSRRSEIVSDFQPFKDGGLPGMSFASLDGPGYNHTGYDSVDHVDPSIVQHQGDTILAMVRRLGEVDLWDLHRPDVVVFDVVDGFAASYSRALVWPFAVLAVLCVASAFVVGWRRHLLGLRGVAWSLAAVALALAIAMGVMGLVWAMYRTAYEEHTWSDSGVVISDTYRLGLVLVTAATVTAAYGAMLRRLRAWDLAAAAQVWWVAGVLIVAGVVPGASYLLTWPLVAGSLGLLVAFLLGERVFDGYAGAAVVVLAGLPAMVFMSSATYLLLASAGLKQVFTVLAVWFTCGLLILPLEIVRRALGRAFPAVLAGVGLVILMVAGSTVAFDATHPRFDSVFYRVDATGQPTWQVVERLDDWTSQFFTGQRRAPFTPAYFPQLGSRPTITASAPSLGLTRPRLTVVDDEAVQGMRTVRLHVASTRAAPVVSLVLESIVGRLSAWLDDQPVARQDTTIIDGTPVRWSFDYYATPAKGYDITLRFSAGKTVRLRVVDFSYGVPAEMAGRYAARPRGVLPGRIGDGALTERLYLLPAKAGGGLRVAPAEE
jgi:Peptidase family M28